MRDEAAKAIQAVDGFGYDNLILHVEWAKCVVAPRGGRRGRSRLCAC